MGMLFSGDDDCECCRLRNDLHKAQTDLYKAHTDIRVLLATIEKLLEFIRLVAADKRPDGTYNRCREALEISAKELLKSLDKDKVGPVA